MLNTIFYKMSISKSIFVLLCIPIKPLLWVDRLVYKKVEVMNVMDKLRIKTLGVIELVRML